MRWSLTGGKNASTHCQIMQNAAMKSAVIFASAALLMLAACNKEPKKLGSHTVAVVFVGGPDAVIRTKAGDVKATKGAILNESDWIQTGAKTHVDLALPGNIVLRVDEKTTLKLTELGLSEGGIQSDKLLLERGTVFAKVAKLDKRSAFAIQTPTVVAGVRGTKFMTQTDEKGAGKVAVIEGRVAVQSNAGKTEEVGEGEQAQVTESGGVTETKIDPATAARVNEMASGVDKIKQDQLQIFENLFKNQKEALEKAGGTEKIKGMIDQNNQKIEDQKKRSDEAVGGIKGQTDQKIQEMKAKTDDKMQQNNKKMEDASKASQDAIDKVKSGGVEDMMKKQKEMFNK